MKPPPHVYFTLCPASSTAFSPSSLVNAPLRVRKNIQYHFGRAAQARSQRCHLNWTVNQNRILQHIAGSNTVNVFILNTSHSKNHICSGKFFRDKQPYHYQSSLPMPAYGRWPVRRPVGLTKPAQSPERPRKEYAEINGSEPTCPVCDPVIDHFP